MYNLTDRNIVLGVSGSIAAYKAADLASKLTQAGVKLEVVLTPAAARFVSWVARNRFRLGRNRRCR